MSQHFAELFWQFEPHEKQPNSYSRLHALTFENGVQVQNSAAVDYFGDADATNPETLLLGALMSCHMMTFLAIAEKRGYRVKTYADKAIGTLGKNVQGRMSIVHCQLNPIIEFDGEHVPNFNDLKALHASSHRNCFIANSVSFPVDVI